MTIHGEKKKTPPKIEVKKEVKKDEDDEKTADQLLEEGKSLGEV